MAESIAANKVYARALLRAAGPKADAVAEVLTSLIAAFDADPSLWAGITDPKVTTAQRKAAFEALLGKDHPVTRNFLHVLIENGRLGDLHGIVTEYEALVAAQASELDVQVTTAVALPAELRAQLEKRLASSTGQTVRLHESVDPAIIGGLVIQHGDTLVDSSVRGRLDSLRLTLRHTK